MKLSFTSLFALSSVASSFAAPSFFAQHELDAGSRRGREGNSLIDKLRSDERFSRFVEILEKEKGLRDELEGRDKKTTVFAPTNEAIEKHEEDWTRSRSDQPEWKDVLRYHVANDADISKDCLHAGAIIPTALRLKTLDDRHQRIRVFTFGNTVLLNARAAVEGEQIEAENGIVHAINGVLYPPKSVTEMINAVPTKLSTTMAALERTGLACDLEKDKALTVFAPSNAAWEALGMFNTRYLFSCAGQQTEEHTDSRGTRREWCEGVKQLKQIMENHIASELAYSTDIMDKNKMTLKTWGDQKLKVCAKEREQQGEGGDRRRRRNRNRNRDEDEEEHHDIRKYLLTVNDGEARIQVNDILANNGAVHMMDNVLLGDMELPFAGRMMQ